MSISGTKVDGLSTTTPIISDIALSTEQSNPTILKQSSWKEIRELFKGYFDTVYQAVLVSGTNIKTINSTSLLGSGNITISGGAGDVVGPASATDNAIARFDTTTGKLIQNSAATIADTSGDITAGKYNTVAISGTSTPTLAVTGTTAVSGTNTGDNATNTTYTTLATTLSTANTWSAVQTFLAGMMGLRNVANTFTSFFTNTNTASRTYTLKDASGTLAFTTDITGTNSGTNTGNQTITNTSDATSHTVALSATGGSVKLVEGANITLTTTGTGADGIVTIASTGGAGLTNFTEAVNTSAPNATVPVVSFTATNAATNVDYASIPKGTGAFLTAIPDNLTAGGNKRGNYAIDLQTLRTANTQVAAGTEAIVIGSKNTATLSNSIAIGNLNSATKAESMAIGVGNSATGTNQSNAVGYTNIASGDNSSAFGSTNTASGQYSSAIGYLNTASGVRATSIGGGEGTAQSFGETVLGLYPTTGAGTTGSYVSTDRLLVVGNGTAEGSRANAITVLKNGNTTIAGTIGASNLSGTNTGDQTSIVGITGTLAQFNAAVTDADLARTDAANTFTGVQTMTSPALTTPAITGLATGSGVATANTVSTLVARDGSGNFSAGTITAALTGTASGNLVSGGALGTPSSGTLTNCTGLPVAGITASTSTALGVGSIELGHASDTSITRVSAGVVAVEGVNILLNGGALGTPSSGTLTNATGLPIAGLTASTSTAIGVGSIELGHASDTSIARVSAGVIAVEGVTVPTTSSTSTLTNKRITKRVETVASSATPASNTDSYDVTKITGLAVAITSLTSGLTGTPVDGDLHMWSFTDNGTARSITPGASFENSTVSFPTTTVISTRLDVLCAWNSATSKWRVVASA